MDRILNLEGELMGIVLRKKPLAIIFSSHPNAGFHDSIVSSINMPYIIV